VSLPDRTLCWVQGPPWDRSCDPVGVLLPSEETTLDKALLHRRLEYLDNAELGVVLALVLARLDELGSTPLPVLLRQLADEAEEMT
jgi:hypothetical protein